MRTITIQNLQVKPSFDGLTNVVETILYRVTDTVTLNGNEHEVTGGGVARLANPNPAEFTPFESLTEATVISWVTANEDIDTLVARLANNLEMRLNPPIVTMTPPWEA